MAAPIQIRSLPDNVRSRYDKQQVLDEVLMEREVPRQYQRNSEDVQHLKFPSTKNILWDHEAIGEPYTLHISYFRNPKLCLSEKLLRFTQRHAESTGQKSCGCVLVGSLVIDDDNEGLTFNVEQFELDLNPNSSSNLAAGDMLIPFTVQSGCKERNSSVEDYSNAIQLLQQRCSSKNPVELANFLLTKGWCSFYKNGDQCVHHLEFDLVTMGTEIKAVPIGPVPIVPTALSKNLSGPMSISHMQGVPKTGYLTMDHTRKLLLVLESDPKVVSLPLVGIWVSGVTHPYSPYVWAACLRYLYNSSIQDRVCSPPDPFLLVLYNPSHSKPEFYECSTANGTSNMSFNFYSGYEAVQVPKNGSSTGSVEVELSLVENGAKFNQFEVACRDAVGKKKSLNESTRSHSPEPTSQEDITPRFKPVPHQSKMELMQSMVPEVSLFFGDDETLVPNVQHPKETPHPSQKFASAKPVVQQRGLPPMSSYTAQSIPNKTSVPNSSLQNGYTSEPVRTNTVDMRVPHSAGSNLMPGCQTPAGHMTAAGGDQGMKPHLSPDSAISSPYPPNSMYPSPHSGFHSHNMGPSPYGLRPGSCSCPGCQKPQFYQGPSPYDMRGPPTYPRPMFSNSGPFPARAPAPHHGYSASYPYHPVSQGYHGDFPARPPPAPYSQPPVQTSNPGPIPQQYSTAPTSVPAASQGVFLTSKSYPPPSVSNANNAQQHNGVPAGPQVSQGLPSQAEATAKSPRTPANSRDYENHQNQNPRDSQDSDVRRSNQNSDNSGRSSDDSGLSFTPEKQTSPNNQGKNSQKEDSPVLSSKAEPTSSLGGINWSSVPPEIYQLLQQQNEQLKQLQAQIQVLTHQQSMNTTATSQDNLKLQQPAEPDKCSAATNTSGQYSQQKEQVSACMQTSPQKFHNSSQSQSSSSGSNYDPRTPMDIRHRGRLPMNSTQREDLELDMSQGELVALMNNMHDKTIDSVQSEMIVDLPSFQSSPSRSPRSQESYSDSTTFNLSPRSPISASMCEQGPGASDGEEESEDTDNEGEEDNTNGTDNPEYYNRLMDNIKKLLSQNTTEADDYGGYHGDISSDQSTPVKMAREDFNLGAQLQSFMMMDNTARTATDTTFIPKINYVSMFLDSDTDTSMEINAMAMKYLKDEQLTQLTKLQAKNRLLNGTKKSTERTALLQKILKAEDDSTPNVTNCGISPNNMTFNTKKYMEKHGLLDGTMSNGSNTTSEVSYDSSYRLKTSYSTMSSGTDDGPAQVTQEVLGTGTPDSQNRTPVNGAFTPASGKSYQTTPSQQNDTRLTDSLSRTPRPAFNRSRLDDHKRVTPDSHIAQNSSIPQSHNSSVPHSNNASPYQQQLLNRDPYIRVGANGRYASPQITPAPNMHKHSPPERDNTTPQGRCSNDGHRDSSPAYRNQAQQQRRSPEQQQQQQHSPEQQQQRRSPEQQQQRSPEQQQQRRSPEQEHQEVPNYYSTRQHRPETIEDDRILDITRLKQLPKLL